MMTPEQRKAALVKNGITPEDLEQEWHTGYGAGVDATLKTVYAGVCLALHDLYGFGLKRCKDVLRATENHVLQSLTSEEAIEEVFQKIGLRLAFDQPFDRIQEDDKNAGT
jgi:hypothetical protein